MLFRSTGILLVVFSANKGTLLHILKITIKIRKLTFLDHYHLILGPTQVSPIVPILFLTAKGSIQNHVYLVMSLKSFFNFHNLDTFEDYGPVNL